MLSFLDPLLPLWGVCEYPRDLPSSARLPEGAKRVVAAAFPYRLLEEFYAGRNISRYAVPRDYHAVCGGCLEHACVLLRAAYLGEEFIWFCDNSPLPEVELAQRAGLGVRGRHNLLITEQYGSWVFLGEIVTSAKLIVNCPPSGHGSCAALYTVNCQLLTSPSPQHPRPPRSASPG